MSELEMTGLTDPGRVRPENEDSIVVRPEIGLAILADGMGGHQAGEVASRLAVDVIQRHLIEAFARAAAEGDEGLLSEAIRKANAAVYEAARERPEYAGMGSTVVVAVFHGDKLYFGHVGDSRLYRYRDGLFTPLTRDHSVIQELVGRGLLTEAEARATIAKNLVTRALGVDPDVEPEMGEETYRDADVYLLCSDGLNDMLSDDEIARLLAEHEPNLEEAARHMVDTANARGGPDNISVILARTKGRFMRRPEAAQALQNRLQRG
jgi:protein phosphatase